MMNHCGMCNRPVTQQRHEIVVGVRSYFWRFCSFTCLELWISRHAEDSIATVKQMIDEEPQEPIDGE